MTKQAIREGFEQPAPGRADGAARGRRALALRGRLAGRHERDSRGHDSRSRLGRRRRLARPGPDADAGDDREAASARSRPSCRSPTGSFTRVSTRLRGALVRGATRRGSGGERAPRRSPPRWPARRASSRRSSARKRASARRSSTTSPRCSATPTVASASRPRARSAAAQSLYESKKAITYPRTSSRYLSGDMVSLLKPTAATLEPIQEYAEAARFVLDLEQLPLAPRGQRRQGRGSPRDHPDQRRARHRSLLRRRAAHLRPRRAPLPGRLPSAGALREDDRRHARSRASASARAARSPSSPAGAPSTGSRPTRRSRSERPAPKPRTRRARAASSRR